MKRTVLSCLAGLSAIGGSVLFFYSFPEWFPVLYAVSVVLMAASAGIITWLFAKKRPAGGTRART